MTDDGIDWARLRAHAIAASAHAYAPYSSFPVGAAALVDDGRLLAGCNVENASFGLTLCAECAVVSALAMTGGGRLVALVAVDGSGEVITPCGRCRQLLNEHAADGMRVGVPGPIASLSIDELLPAAFGPRNLGR